MARAEESLYTIDDLHAQAALALSFDYEGAPNGRVRDLPDARTIRFYTGLGLLDRPLSMRGRTALYGRRHLFQLVAIKRLQARGLTLARIQEELLGLPLRALSRLARVPPEAIEAPPPASVPGPVPAREAPDARDRRDFWLAAPAPPASSSEGAPDGDEVGEEIGEEPPLIQGIPIRKGLTILLEAGRRLEKEDLEAIESSLGPLLAILERRRLLEPENMERTSS